MKAKGIFATFVLVGVVLSLLVGTSGATWCNNDYAKRINVSVNNTGGSTLTDYQVYVNLFSYPINETSIRVYNATSCTLRPHWCENITNRNCSKLWINYSAVTASTWTNNTAIYYENASVSSVSNGTNTFILFDDFEAGSLDTNKWTIGTGVENTDFQVSSGKLEVGLTSTRTSLNSANISLPFIINSYVDFAISGSDDAYSGIIALVSGLNASQYCYDSYGCSHTQWCMYKYPANTYTGFGTAVSVYKDVEIKVQNTTQEGRIGVDTQNGDVNFSGNIPHVELYGGDGTTYFEEIYVHKYTSPEPTSELNISDILLSVTSPTEGSNYSSPVTVSGTTNHNANVTYEFDSNGTVFTACINCKSFSNNSYLSLGSHNVSIVAKEYGNSSNNDTELITFTIVDPCACSNCAECMNKLSDASCSLITLTANITNYGGGSGTHTCVNNPANSDNKIFDMNGYIIEGDSVGTKTSWSTGDFGIFLSGKTNITIKNGTIKKFGTGIYTGSCSYITVQDAQIVENNLTTGWDCGVYDSGSSRVRWERLNLSENGAYATAVLGASTYIYIEDCYANNTLSGDCHIFHHITSGPYNIEVENSSCDGVADYAIWLGNAHNVTVTNSSFNDTGNLLDPTYLGGFFYSTGSYDIDIINSDFTYSKYGYGFHILSNSDNINITNNTINYSARHGIYIADANCNNINITENTICENNLNASSYYDIYDADSNSGDENTCDTTSNWNDTGTTGCTYACSNNSTLHLGNVINIKEDWGRDFNSNLSANVTTANASVVWMNFSNAEFTNTSLGWLNLTLDEWVNESHNVNSPVTNVSVAVYLNSTTSGATNDTDSFWYEVTKRTNTATMDSAATQTANTSETFYVNATCNEEYGDTFLGAANLLEDGAIVATNSSVTNYVNFSHSESSVGQYNYTIRFYNLTHYDNATTPTYSNVTVSDAEYIPPDATTLANSTGNFWVNHTWSAGGGNITNSYNVSVNLTWYNGTTNLYYNNTPLTAHNWSNITVWAYNTSGNGTLSAGSISQNTQIPNNAPVLSGLPDNTTTEDVNQTDIFDLDDYFTDTDGDTPTYLVESNNQSAYVSVTINASNNVSYTLASGWNGTASIVINVTDGWGGEDNDTFLIIVNAAPLPGDYTPGNPTNLQNTTGNYWVNYTWNVGGGNVTDSYNVSWNLTWYNGTMDTFMKKEVGASNWANITVYAFNSSGNGTLSLSYLSDNVQAPAFSPGDYIPPNPTTLLNSTGNYYVNYTWVMGVPGNVTDSYNVSWNLTWYNGTLTTYMQKEVGASNWGNITVYAYNSSGNGTLSGGSVSDNVQAPAYTPGDYIPANPTTLANTTGNGWVNYTWSSGGGANVTDSYNVSWNSTWYNNTLVTYMNDTVGEFGWANISVWAFNSSGNGSLSAGSISDETQAGGGTFTTSMTTGVYNLITYYGESNSTAEQFGIDIGSVDYIAMYNGSFYTHTMGFAANNFTTYHGIGYYVYLNASGSSTYQRNNISDSPYNTQLFNRWNTVGWTNATDTNAEGVASSIGSACKYTSMLNADGITYTTHTVGFTSNNHAVEKGKGYWIWVNAGVSWGRNS